MATNRNISDLPTIAGGWKEDGVAKPKFGRRLQNRWDFWLRLTTFLRGETNEPSFVYC